MAENVVPTPGQISNSFDKIVGRVLSGHLATLFENVSSSLAAMIHDSHFPQIQEYLTRFLFDPGFQEIGVRISDGATQVRVHHDSTNSNSLFPIVKQPGDLDIVAHFFPIKIENANKGQSAVNELNLFLCMSGMPPAEIVIQRLRELIVCGSNGGKATGYPSQMGAALLAALKLTFPNGHAFAAAFLEMSSVELDLQPCTGGLFVELSAEINTQNLEKLYPALANLLKHLSDVEISIVDMHDPTKNPETDVFVAKCMMQIRIVYVRGVIELHVCMMLPATQLDCLLWFDRTTKTCVMDTSGLPMEVDFMESEIGYKRSLRVLISGAFRIPQLGCGSIALPLIIAELKCSSSKCKFSNLFGGETPAQRFDITILHMSEKRLTALLLRPFFNLDLLRFILLNHFHVQIDIAPPFRPKHLTAPAKDSPFVVDEDDEFEEFFDAKEEEEEAIIHEEISITHPAKGNRGRNQVESLVSPHWFFTWKLHMFLPQPPKVLTSCLNLFVGQQISEPDDLRFLIEMMMALSKDLSQMHARLAKPVGDKLDLKDLSANNSTLEGTDVKDKETSSTSGKRNISTVKFNRKGTGKRRSWCC